MKKLCTFCVLFISITCFSQRIHYVTEFSSFGDYDMSGKTFYVESGNPEVSNKDPEFKYYAGVITQILLLNKAIPTDKFVDAEVCILLDYGISDESYIATRSIPIWGQTGISSITTTSNTRSRTYGTVNGSATTYGSSSGATTYGTASGSTYGSGTTTTTQNYNYNYGVTGFHDQSYKVEEFRRVLNLYAYDNKQRQGEPVVLWKLNATSDGSSRDLSSVFLYMAYAVQNYCGRSTNELKRYRVDEKDGTVLCMKQKLFLKDNVVVSPTNYSNEHGCASLVFRAAELKKNSTTLYLIGQKRENTNIIKTPSQTYIIYKGEKYPVSSIYAPTEWDEDLIGKKVFYVENCWILLKYQFPVEMQKGDSFDFVSYENKKETKELFHYRNLVLE